MEYGRWDTEDGMTQVGRIMGWRRSECRLGGLWEDGYGRWDMEYGIRKMGWRRL